MPNLMSKGQLRNLRRDAAVVVHKSYHSRIQASLRLHLPASDILSVGLVLLADATRRA